MVAISMTTAILGFMDINFSNLVLLIRSSYLGKFNECKETRRFQLQLKSIEEKAILRD